MAVLNSLSGHTPRGHRSGPGFSQR